MFFLLLFDHVFVPRNSALKNDTDVSNCQPMNHDLKPFRETVSNGPTDLKPFRENNKDIVENQPPLNLKSVRMERLHLTQHALTFLATC